MASPVRSTYREQLESIDSQADFGLRTADFFDDSTSEEEVTGILDDERQDLDLLDHDRQGSLTPKRRSKPLPMDPVTQCESRGRLVQPEGDGYLRLSPVRAGQGNLQAFVGTPSSSFNGSVEELFPGEQPSSPPSFPHAARLSALRQPRDSIIMPRSEPAMRSSSVVPTPEPRKVDHVLAHAIAHEITLQALMRDEATLKPSAHSFAPLDRTSMLPASLRLQIPTHNADDLCSTGMARKFSTPAASHASTAKNKNVHVLPPPTGTTAPHLPADLIRTPYPTSSTPRPNTHLKHFPHFSTPSELNQTPATPTESVLILYIRRRTHASRPRITTLVMPSPGPPTSDHSNNSSSSFDDAAFFTALRASYATLTGRARIFSALKLRRIAVCSPSSRAADQDYGWLHAPRSPRVLARKGLSDIFGEEKVLEMFRKPALGKGRFAFVMWGRRLGKAEGRGTFGDVVGEEGEEGLEFVLGWAVRRIVVALALVCVVSVAAALLWVFLGKNSEGLEKVLGVEDSGAGYKGAGARVATGLVMGIGVLLLGLSGLGGWLGVSWLVM